MVVTNIIISATCHSLLSLMLLGPHESFGKNASRSFPPNRPLLVLDSITKWSCKLSETVMRMMTDLMLFQRRTRNLSPCSSAVMVKRRWSGTRRIPTPASVYLVWF